MRFQLTLLGTSGSVPAYGRHCSGVVLSTDTTDVLIDCGEGTQYQLQRAGIGPGKLSDILITHLHGDHYFGLPGLISSLALSGRRKPLRITSPEHLRPRLAALFELDRFPMPFALEFRTLHATEMTALGNVGDLEVFAFPLRHRVPTNGYLLRERPRQRNIRKNVIPEYDIPYQLIPGIKAGNDFVRPDGTVVANDLLTLPPPRSRSFAYCSDTIYFPELANHVRDVDLLYHEATFLSDMGEDATKKGHSTAAQAATVARDAGAERLIMGHFSSRYPRTEAHEAEARAVFLASDAGKDLAQYEVPFRRAETRTS